ncbi:hypothetical protein TWF173_009310 [Orbilia oligospora]|nr:hypothetical protein TWF173_009310 [Orbilia oligospora]
MLAGGGIPLETEVGAGGGRGCDGDGYSSLQRGDGDGWEPRLTPTHILVALVILANTSINHHKHNHPQPPTRKNDQVNTKDTLRKRAAISMSSNSTAGLTTGGSGSSSYKTRQYTHLQGQLAQLQANLSDMEELLRMTSNQAEKIRTLGGLQAGLFMGATKVFEDSEK